MHICRFGETFIIKLVYLPTGVSAKRDLSGLMQRLTVHWNNFPYVLLFELQGERIVPKKRNFAVHCGVVYAFFFIS